MIPAPCPAPARTGLRSTGPARLTRATAWLAYLALTAATVYGLLLTTGVLDAISHRAVSFSLHRDLSATAIAFTAIHAALLTLDSTMPFSAVEVLVPFASGWRPIAVAWGVVSAYLLIAVELSSLLRKHIPKSAWRKIHFLSFPLFLTATAHGITAGTEFGTTVGIGIAALVTAAIAGLTTLRVISEVEKAKQPPAPRIAAPRVTAPRTVVTLSEPVSPYPDIDLAPPTWLQPPAPARPEPDAAPVRTGRAF